MKQYIFLLLLLTVGTTNAQIFNPVKWKFEIQKLNEKCRKFGKNTNFVFMHFMPCSALFLNRRGILTRGCSSSGRALPYHARSTGIDTPHLQVSVCF